MSTLSLLLTSIFCVTFAQEPRDVSPRVATEIASIFGRVVTADAAATPVRRAMVTITWSSRPTTTSVITDDEGRFLFADVPAGRILVTASKPAYATTAYGALAPGRPGTPIDLAAGQRADIVVKLARGAAISGSLRTPSGEPVPDMLIRVLPARSDGATAASPAAAVFTDDRGMYRAFGLAPGEYLVAETMSAIGTGLMAVLTPEQVDADLQQLQERQRLGTTAAAPAASVPQTYGYAPIFYPGTSVASEATKVSVRAGEDRTGVDLTVTFVRTAAIEGMIVSPAGEEGRSLRLALLAHGPALIPPLGWQPSSESTDATTKFRFIGVPPGSYTIAARTTSLSPRSSAATRTLWSLVDVDVAGTDIDDVRLTLQPAMALTGRVVFDSTILKPLDPTKLRVTLTETASLGVSMLPGDVRPFTTTVSAPVRADGTFDVTGVLPGRYAVAIDPVNANWSLRSALTSGQDVLDTQIEFRGDDIADAVITLTDLHSELSGVLQDASGQPTPDFAVVIFPVDRALRRSPRRLQSLRPTSDGKFSVRDLPSGEYLVSAVADIQAENLKDPQFLEQLAGSAVKVTVREGETTRQDVRILR